MLNRGQKIWIYLRQHPEKLRERNRKISESLKGKSSPLKGKTYEEIYGIKEAKIQRHKKSITKIGARNPCWRGGEPRCVYRRKDWIKIRKLVLERDNHLCQLCGKNIENKKWSYNIHHIKDFREVKNHDLNNLIALCISCHTKVTFSETLIEDMFENIWINN